MTHSNTNKPEEWGLTIHGKGSRNDVHFFFKSKWSLTLSTSCKSSSLFLSRKWSNRSQTYRTTTLLKAIEDVIIWVYPRVLNPILGPSRHLPIWLMHTIHLSSLKWSASWRLSIFHSEITLWDLTVLKKQEDPGFDLQFKWKTRRKRDRGMGGSEGGRKRRRKLILKNWQYRSFRSTPLDKAQIPSQGSVICILSDCECREGKQNKLRALSLRH